jgi:hypothetical protein
MKVPVLDVFIGRDGDAWRLYFARSSWVPATLGVPERGSIFPVAQPDPASLNRWMRRTRSRALKRATASGGMEIQARGRDAVALASWLQHLVDAARRAAANREAPHGR